MRGPIGQGGMGVVYRVLDRELQREVALKTMRRPSPGELYRLKTEFRARAELNHPGIVDFYDLAIEGAACFFTMELVDGVDLLTWVRNPRRGGWVDESTVAPDEEDPTAAAVVQVVGQRRHRGAG
jgi:serine/threonine protein kinase